MHFFRRSLLLLHARTRARPYCAGVSSRFEPRPIQVFRGIDGVFAGRRIQAGETILKANAIVSHPLMSTRERVCSLCLRILPPGSLHLFCSEECREQAKGFRRIELTGDWWEFEDHCRREGLEYPFLIKRVVCLILSNSIPYDIFAILPKPTATRSCDDLSKTRKQLHLLYRAVDKMAIFQRQQLARVITEDWYTDLLESIRQNSFPVVLPGEGVVGNAVYATASCLKRDPNPNVRFSWSDSSRGKVIAITDIDALQELSVGEVIAITDALQELSLGNTTDSLKLQEELKANPDSHPFHEPAAPSPTPLSHE